MQTFARTKVALAVGAALMAMAGAAQAAAVVPLTGATKALLSTSAVASAAELYAPQGTVKAVRIAYLANAAIANGGATTINTGTAANDDVTVQFGSTLIPAAQLAVAYNVAGIGNGNNIAVTITPVAPAKVRINNTNGALEYTADSTATTPVWAAVTMSIQAVAGNALTDGGVAIDAATAATNAFASTDFVNTAAQTVKTYSTAGADKISGLTVDFFHPVAAPTKSTLSLNAVPVPPLASAVDISNSATAGISAVNYTASAGTTAAYDVVLADPKAVDWDNNGTINAVDALLYAPTSFNTGVAGVTSPLSVTVAATGPAYTNIFVKTTGQAALVAPGAIGGPVVDGAPPVIVANGITFSTPSAATPSLTNVGVTFSEPMQRIFGDDLREVLENIFVGSNTLAALSLNSGVTVGGPVIATSGGQSTVTVTGIATDDVATVAAGIYTGKSMSVSRGITYQEVNDTNYTANVKAGTTLDDVAGTGPNGEELSGGIKSASGVVEAIPATPAALIAVAPKPSVAWGTDTSAKASASSATSPDLIDTITVTFAAGKGVKYAPAGTVFGTAGPLTAAKTATDLADNLVVDVFGSNGIRFQIRPSSATLDTPNTITVKVPTALIYSKLTAAGTQLKSVWIGYNADGANSTNNTLVSNDAASTLLAPVIVEKGLISNSVSALTGNGWVDSDLTAAGAEPVVLPLVFTAVYTGGQSTLLTQDVQGNIAGGTAGSIVNAYLAYWVDSPTTTPTATISSGKITNPSDKVATDLAIEFADQAALTALIQAQLAKVAPAQPAKPGISNAVPAGAASPFPVYVKLVRSNDTSATAAQTGTQNYLNARAVLATTFAGAATATPLGSAATNDRTDPVYEVMLNPTTGAITGRLTGNLVIKTGTFATVNRGLRFLNGNGVGTAVPTLVGSSVLAQKSATGLALPGTANINLLMGIDPASNDLAALQAKKPFVLLVLEDAEGKFTQLTSANPQAVNYLPFAPDVLNKATGSGGVYKRAPLVLSVTDVKALPLPASSSWALYGIGNRALAAKPAVTVSAVDAFTRDFIGLETVTGTPKSFWTNDSGAWGDMALTMAGNNVGVATDLTTAAAVGSTLSTIAPANVVKGAVGLAWANANGATDGGAGTKGKLFVAQATGAFAPTTAAPAPTLAPGWSLVNVPGAVGAPVAALGSVVDAVIKVGAQVGAVAGAGNGQFTWLAEDGAMPALTGGEAVFVHAKAKGNL